MISRGSSKWVTAYHLVIFGYGNDNIQAFPDIVLQLPNIHSLCPPRIIDKLRPNTSRLTRRAGQQVLSTCIDTCCTHSFAVDFVYVVEPWSIVVVVVEELGVERDCTSICGCIMESAEFVLQSIEEGLTFVAIFTISTCCLVCSSLSPEILVNFAILFIESHPLTTHLQLFRTLLTPPNPGTAQAYREFRLQE
jgi:hypothetical protein